MKLKIKRELLLENLNNVSKALSTKNLIPILSGIKFDLQQEGLFLNCSDDDITIQTFIDKSKLEENIDFGNIVIPGKYILEIIRKIPTDSILIETDGSKILIKTDKSEYTLNGMDATEYPNYNLSTTKTPIIINNKIFKSIINQTSFAISTQESRPILTGINFKIENDMMEVLATDSYRLAKKSINLNSSVVDKINVVIPGKNLIELTKILNDDDNNIEIHIFSNSILFKYENILFQSRLLNGSYPNVGNLIPSEFELKIEANMQELYSIIDRASLLSDKDKNIVQLQNSDNEIIVTSDSLEVGKVEERMNLTEKSTKKIKISFNSKYMMEALRSFQSKQVIIQFNDDMKPIILKDSKNDSLIQLILPIKTY